jgi:hypothetical protein
MKCTAGAGTLFACGRRIHIFYDLVQQDERESAPIVGTIFGDAEDLYEAFYAPRSTLRLENGQHTPIVLQNFESRGAAEVRIVGPMRWD